MQISFFSIPVSGGEAEEESLNVFLRSHKVVSVEKQFCGQCHPPLWSLCVTVAEQTLQGKKTEEFVRQSSKSKVDYKEVLDEPTFEIFSRLREIRKQIATSDGVPLYAVFSNSELAEIAKLETIDELGIVHIPGIGPERTKKYGSMLCSQYRAEMEKEN